ncbi:MAG TPA: type VI secretion system lipoprotein TssJ [Gammaproteobacteria bacterium]|nr:type VI secretion system lipoprotein TssJ [Gammaproteobacteria bacterium]
MNRRLISRWRLPAGLGLLLAACVSGCASAPAVTVPPNGWTYGARALQLVVAASPSLNMDSGQPHALALGVFQLSDPAAFAALTTSDAGAARVLAQGKAADPGVVGFDRVILQPGQHKTVFLSRAKDAQYVAFVAGYYKITPASDVALFNVPVQPVPTSWLTKGLVAVGLKSASSDGEPIPLTVAVGLGPTQVTEFVSRTPGSARITGTPPAAGGAEGAAGGDKSKSGSGSDKKQSGPALPSLPGSGGGG